jgi:NADH:ubiquinone oxidoreductase subunit K
MNTGATTRHASASAAWVNVLLGLWVAISPFVLGVSQHIGPMCNNIAIGVVVMVLGLIGGYAYRGALALLVPLSVWLFASTFAFGFSSMAFLWSNVIMAFFIIATAAAMDNLRSSHPLDGSSLAGRN